MAKNASEEIDRRALLKDLKTMRQIVNRLEGAVLASEDRGIDPYRRRR